MTLLIGVQFAASIAICVLAVLWFQRSRDFNRLNAVARDTAPRLAANKAAFSQLVGDSVVYSQKNPSMRTLLNQIGITLPPAANSAPASGPGAVHPAH